MIKKIIGTTMLGIILGFSGAFAANLEEIPSASSKIDKSTVQRTSSAVQKTNKDVGATNKGNKPEAIKDRAVYRGDNSQDNHSLDMASHGVHDDMKREKHTEHAFNRPDKTGANFNTGSALRSGPGASGNSGVSGGSVTGHAGGWANWNSSHPSHTGPANPAGPSGHTGPSGRASHNGHGR